ncbi:conserved hypothetical protein [Beutenbergia cavernae DSM 12333]|uniref:DUF5063 domain-containing protein n=1 Tax=Beutenbergia cavernae (strain ATCC BAA-8 / DSM 12333 / CCUG 43141 / JCM 11478 / NBRC 16432 / NCIMB 13614 / HKI 0122) TaxID=471853 RepID=C5BXR9_BEUC1|nr:DUF5063 domain-containing protein [Beutenbergia cavernae]ACQ78813.1 conserved hypothetical protein [Beutenbergia cavernae DSM 12333]
MSDTPEHQDPAEAPAHELDADLTDLAGATAGEVRRYLTTITEVAAGANPDAAIPLLLLAVSDLLAAGSRLGAIVDVVPAQRFEPDDGPDVDLEPLRRGLENLLEGIDEYTEVSDPLVTAEVAVVSLSGDLVTVAQAAVQGLQHFEAGHTSEALWWWQYSYLSSWGERAAAALRALLSVLGHLRLDVPDDVAAEAEFEALHQP